MTYSIKEANDNRRNESASILKRLLVLGLSIKLNTLYNKPNITHNPVNTNTTIPILKNKT